MECFPVRQRMQAVLTVGELDEFVTHAASSGNQNQPFLFWTYVLTKSSSLFVR
jgi:hypothetical protein